MCSDYSPLDVARSGRIRSMNISADILEDLDGHSLEHLQKELASAHHALDLLFTKNNSLDELDLIHGGGSTEDQAEYQRLHKTILTLDAEVQRRRSQAAE